MQPEILRSGKTALKLLDRFNRPLTDLRLSVTDRCQLRCRYCMPQINGSISFLKEKEYLDFEQIETLCQSFVALGINKIRITGGEPLLRPRLPQLIRSISAIKNLSDLALTTNGILLTQYAPELKESGLQRLTVSLDSLDNKTFQKLSGSRFDVNQVLKGIDAAQKAGFKNIKINTVVQRGINEHDVLKLAEYFRGSGHIVRFIEYMDVGTVNQWNISAVVPNSTIFARINMKYPLRPLGPKHFGEVASRYAYLDGQGEIGFVSSITQPFCGSCTRLRVSADGKLYNCLFAGEGYDLSGLIDNSSGSLKLPTLIANIWENRADKYSENRYLFHLLKQNIQKIDMFRIGG